MTDHETIRVQLDRITGSESFRSSPLLSKFLRFTVEQTLAGETDSLKETVLGVEVCGRTRFDPRYDSVVRTTASRLRTKLTEYYEGHPDDELRIAYPRGSYVPQFEPGGAAVTQPDEPLDLSDAAPYRRPPWILWAAGTLAVSILSASAGYFLAQRRLGGSFESPVTRRFQLSYPPGTQSGPLTSLGLAQISPDGTKIAVALRTGSESAIWLHSLETSEWRRMTPPGMNATHPFWAPSSEEFGFSTYRAMRRMRVDGTGASQVVAELPSVFNSASWSETGKILFSSSPQAGLMVVPASGGKPVQVTHRLSPQESWHYSPEFLPGTQEEFLYTSVFVNRVESKVYLSSLARPAEKTELLEVPSNVSYFPASEPRDGGYLVYQGPGSVMAVRFDKRAKKVVGAPVSVGPSAASDIWRGSADLSVSKRDGSLIYRTGTGFQKRRLRLLDPAGKLLESSENEELFRFPAWSPDGKSVAVGITDSRTGVESIWIFDQRLRNPRKFSRGAAAEFAPVWSPDSTHIAFVRGTNIFTGPVSGIGEVRQITKSTTPKTTSSWTPDGRRIIFTEYIGGVQQDIRSIEAEGQSDPVSLTTDSGNESDGQVSPDGKYLLYDAELHGHRHVFVEKYPIDPAHREALQLSVAEAYDPRWTKGGAEVVFVVANKQLAAVSLRDRVVRVQYETPTWFHRGYGHTCHPANGLCVLSAPGEEPRILPPVVTIHPSWPVHAGR